MMDYGPLVDVDDEYGKLVIRMNPPRVTVDNTSSKKATLVKVDSVNRHGSLLEVVQALTDLNLTIRRAYISSDGEWFMDVFHVVDQDGNKLHGSEVIDRIQQSLGAKAFDLWLLRRTVGVQASAAHTTIELIGRNRPGLLSEVFAVLTDLKCNVVAAEVWTHNSRMASVVYITDEATGGAIDDADHLSKIKLLLRYVLKGNPDKRSAKTAISLGVTHTERRLHQMMYADRDYDRGDVDEEESPSNQSKLLVTVENCSDKGYSVVNVRCKDRPKLLFDTVCTLTDMQYVVFHATLIAEGPEAYQVSLKLIANNPHCFHQEEKSIQHYDHHVISLHVMPMNEATLNEIYVFHMMQEYYIRHLDGFPISSEAERRRLILCLEAAIKRRNTEGVRLELCCDDRIGLLSDVTRIFRENGLTVTCAEVSTRGSQAVNVFYVMDASGNPVQSQTIEAVRNEIGETILHVKDDMYSKSSPQDGGKFSLGNLFRSRSEKFLYSLGFIRSGS